MAQTPSTAEVRAIAKEAYIWGLPLVDNYRILHSYFVDRSGSQYKAPWNTLVNTARVYTPDDTSIQTPNSDTPFSFIGADLRAEPLVLTLPEVDPSRYYSVLFIDLYTHNFAYLGTRATGNGAGRYLLAGPGWTGEAPAGIDGVIRCETEFALIFYRTQMFEAADIEAVKKVQAGYGVTTLSAHLGTTAPAPAPAIDFMAPLTPEAQKTSPKFFEILNFVLQFCPLHPSEAEMMDRFGTIGIGAGRDLGPVIGRADLCAALDAGMADAWAEFARFKAEQLDTGKLGSGDGFGTREYLNGQSMLRFAGAVVGIYGNSKEEALYPLYTVDSEGQPLTGSQRYRLRFAPGQMPPAKAFWSLTLYEMPASLLSANPLNRYLINSPMLPGLVRDADGGLTLLIQHASPGAEWEANWLPAPEGLFICVLRLYLPEPEAQDGRWKAPPMVSVA